MMPTFEPVAFANVHNLFYGKDLELGDKLFTESQLQQAYEAGNRDAVPEGWQLVPIEPTKAMLLAYTKCKTVAGERWAKHQWKAMLAAAPKGEKE